MLDLPIKRHTTEIVHIDGEHPSGNFFQAGHQFNFLLLCIDHGDDRTWPEAIEQVPDQGVMGGLFPFHPFDQVAHVAAIGGPVG